MQYDLLGKWHRAVLSGAVRWSGGDQTWREDGRDCHPEGEATPEKQPGSAVPGLEAQEQGQQHARATAAKPK